MLPGMGGLNPKKMNAMMKQMGISQEDISASRVIIEKNDNSKLVIDNPDVSKMTIQGQEMYQVSGGTLSEEASTEQEGAEETQEETITEEDIQTIVDKTQCTREKAQEVLEKHNGDLAEAIMELSE